MPVFDPLELTASLLFHALFFAVPVIVFSCLAYFFISLPARRQEQARLFLHVLEVCVRDGRPVEQAVVALAAARDKSPGLRFHLTAAYIEEGDRLHVALQKSRLLPHSIIAMLASGEQIGDLKKVLPACGMQLGDARSGISAAMSHFFVLVLGMSPIALALMSMLMVSVLPKMRDMAMDMSGEGDSGFFVNFLSTSLIVGIRVEAFLILGLVATAILYFLGPEAPGWLRAVTRPVVDMDWFALLLPWKRRRMNRNFAAMLSVLLDSGMAEAEALRQAAAATGNNIFIRFAESAIRRLANGEPLTKAVAALDRAGEFRWRLANATHAKAGFTHALRGWFESLDARAYQQEQAAAHLLTTGLVLINGLIIGCICAGMFGWLTSLIEAGALW